MALTNDEKVLLMKAVGISDPAELGYKLLAIDSNALSAEIYTKMSADLAALSDIEFNTVQIDGGKHAVNVNHARTRAEIIKGLKTYLRMNDYDMPGVTLLTRI